MAPGRQLEFTGGLSGLLPQVILTDFLVDHLYPVQPKGGAEVLATVKGQVVGTWRKRGEGRLVFLGFRPRDDQSKSLGYDARWWFEILTRLGAYPATGKFPGLNDNTEFLSRTSDYLCCRFPNEAVAICRHFRETEEDWPGGFARNEEEDAQYLKRVPPPSEALNLKAFRVNGHTVTYQGQQAMTFRVDAAGNLIAFAGSDCDRITVDGRETVFADRKLGPLAWAPVPERLQVKNGAVLQIMVYGTGTLRLPAVGLPENPRIFAEGVQPGSRGEEISCKQENGALLFAVIERWSGHRLYVTP